MFLFRFIKFYKFRHSEMTPEWEERYDYLCENTDYLYLREKELKASRKSFLGFLVYCIALWCISLSKMFFSPWMIVMSVAFTFVLACYALSTHYYIPMEIEQTKVASKIEATRRPSSVVYKKIREHGIEILHKYYIYTTYSNKKAVDMTDRILGVDQNYNPDEIVLCFTGINNDCYYILPKLEENSHQKENTHEDD